MRIIAGSRKGARIFAPKGEETRPTGDRVREAAFNLIGPVEDMTVLDLFAGSGAMGLEALSRGAESALFVESSRDACRVINANLDKLRLNATVLCSDVLRVRSLSFVDRSEPGQPKTGSRRQAPRPSLEMSANDRRFLKSLRISADEAAEKEAD